MADEQAKSPGGARRVDPPERIQELIELHRQHPTYGRRKIAEDYLAEHPEIVEESRGGFESVVRRLAKRLAEAEGVPEQRLSERALLRQLRNTLLMGALLVDYILGEDKDGTVEKDPGGRDPMEAED